MTVWGRMQMDRCQSEKHGELNWDPETRQSAQVCTRSTCGKVIKPLVVPLCEILPACCMQPYTLKKKVLRGRDSFFTGQQGQTSSHLVYSPSPAGIPSCMSPALSSPPSKFLRVSELLHESDGRPSPTVRSRSQHCCGLCDCVVN
jgi:hypothetical protein